MFYGCRAYHNKDVQPGYAFANDSVCHFGYGGLEMHQPGAGFSWFVDPGYNVSPPPALALPAELVVGLAGDVMDIMQTGQSTD